MSMRIFLTGATGFIGGHLLRSLVDRGHEVTCLARGSGADCLEAMALPGVKVLRGEFTHPESWLPAVAGHEAVVNTVGLVRQSKEAPFAVVHTEVPVALFEAVARAGVRKVVQLSALGADSKAGSAFLRSKGIADQRLAGMSLPHVILRPSFVYGPGNHSMTFFLSLAALPVTPIAGDGEYRVQPVHVDDVVRALVLAIERDDLAGLAMDLGGGSALAFGAMVDLLARWLGKPKGARKLHLPSALMRCVAAATDLLGGHGPITREELSMLERGSVADNRPFIHHFGFEPLPFEIGMARRPRTEAVLWHARLTHLRVPLRLSIAFLWLWTGFVSAFVYPEWESLAMLARSGITGPLAPVVLYGISLFEIGLAVATAVGYRIRLVGMIQLALVLAFTAILTVTMPEFWWHPFGPLSKNAALITATLVMMALEA
jgi:uncharacterized protein YbjT (DUF2867 family)